MHSVKWYERPLRIAALQCNYEDGKNLDVVDRWVDAGFNTEQLFHPMADAYSALFDEARHGKLLHRYLAKTAKAGLRVILYANVHIIGPSDRHRFEEWGQRAADGSYPLLYDTYYACCFNGAWREHFLRIIDRLAAYRLDGIFLDGPVVIQGGCSCDTCTRLFRERTGHEIAAATPEERFAFYRDTKDEFLTEAYRRFKGARPQGLFYINLPVTSPHASYVSIPRALEYNDIVGSEGGFMFYGPARNAPLWKPSMRAKILEAVAPAKPRVVFVAADHKPWSWYPHSPVETRLAIASSVANAAGIWYGLHGSTRLLDTPGCRAGTKLMRFLARNERYYTNTKSASRVAVLYSLDTDREYRSASERSDFYGASGDRKEALGDYAKALGGFCDALSRSSIPYDMVTDLALDERALSRYDLLLLPSCACLSDGAVEAIRGFVRSGGSLIATSDSSLYTEKGERRPDLGLADVFGVRFLGQVTRYRDHDYLSRTETESALFGDIGIPYVPVAGPALEVEAVAGAEVLARFHAPMAGRYVDLTPQKSPAVVGNACGKGRCVYLAGTFGELLAEYALPEHRMMLANGVRDLAPPRVALAGRKADRRPVNVEMVVRRQSGRYIVHLVNYAGIVPRPFAAVSVQKGLELRVHGSVKVRVARALAADRKCDMEKGDGEQRVRLPALAEYEVIVLETSKGGR